jgi:hypothetical protein
MSKQKINQMLYQYKIEIAVFIVKSFIRDRNISLAYEYSKKLASYLAGNPTGCYSHYEFEELIGAIAKRKVVITDKRVPNMKNGKVLHVISEGYKTGGHTKLLANWIKFDTSKEYEIVSTRMNNTALQQIMCFYNLSNKTYHLEGNDFEKAASLRILSAEFDYIVLHTHMDDLIPILAFSQKTEKTPPILLVNHADHSFWTGVSILDHLLQIRETNIPLDEIRREIPKERQYFLPIPISFEHQFLKNTEEKTKVKILMTAAYQKVKPQYDKNIIKDIIPILKDNPSTIFDIVGMTGNEDFAEVHPQINYHGFLPNSELIILENECDIVVESFPISSFTAILQTLSKKKPIQLMYAPPQSMILFPEIPSFNYPRNLNEWQINLNILIQSTNKRRNLAIQQYKYVESTYSLQSWRKKIENIFQSSNKNETKKHKNGYVYSAFDPYIKNFFLQIPLELKSYITLIKPINLIMQPSILFKIIAMYYFDKRTNHN